MEQKIKVTCPLGHKCERRVSDDEIERCAWYTQIQGKDPQSNRDIDEWACAMGWLPVLLIENAQTNRGQTAALESFRNEMVQGQAIFNKALGFATQRKLEN